MKDISDSEFLLISKWLWKYEGNMIYIASYAQEILEFNTDTEENKDNCIMMRSADESFIYGSLSKHQGIQLRKLLKKLPK